MTDVAIRSFLRTCETHSFTAAGNIVHLSQQAVSKQISTLEQELGCLLFTRKSRSVTPTEIGQIYYDFFSRMETEYDKTRRRVRMLQEDESGRIRIGYLARHFISDALYHFLLSYKATHPHLHFTLVETPMIQMAEKLVSEELDLCIGHDFIFQHIRELKTVPYEKVETVLIVSKNHPAMTEPYDPKALDGGQSLYTLDEGQEEDEALRHMHEMYSRLGLTDVRDVFCETMSDFRLGIATGEGFTISNTPYVFQDKASLLQFGTGVFEQLVCAYKKQRSSDCPSSEFIESLQTYLLTKYPASN